MEEQEIYAVLENFKNALDMLQARQDQHDQMYHDSVEQFDERFHKLETTLYEEILKPAQDAIAEKAVEDEFSVYAEKYKDKLEPYNDRLSLLEGREVSLPREAFDSWKEYKAPEGEEGYTEESYVDALVEHVEEQLNGIKEALGLPEDAKVEAVETAEGTEVKVDGETVAETEEPKAEEKAEEETAEDIEDSDELSPEELKELEEAMKKEGLI